MDYLNNIITSQKPSATLEITAQTNAKIAAGEDVVNMGAGEPDFDTPEVIKQAAKTALDNSCTKYTAVPGTNKLREAIAKKLTTENNIPGLAAENVIVCNGGKQAIFNLFAVTLEAGDEVLIPAPYWVSYPAQVELVGAKPVIVATKSENSYKLQADELAAALTPKTKLLILNSPSNPTGAAYSEEEYRSLLEVLKQHHCLVMSDEVYEKIVFRDFKHISPAALCPELQDRFITVNAFSKAYAMTGWRIGYAAGSKEIISSMSKYQSQTTSNVNSIAQEAALVALEQPSEFFKKMQEIFWNRVEIAAKIIEQTPGISLAAKPEGAFYLFIRLDELIEQNKITGSKDFCSKLLNDAAVAAVPGVEFGDDRAFRISIACSDAQVEKGLKRIQEFCLKL